MESMLQQKSPWNQSCLSKTYLNEAISNGVQTHFDIEVSRTNSQRIQ